MYAICSTSAITVRNPNGYIHGTMCSRRADAMSLLADRRANQEAFPGERVVILQETDIPSGWQ